MLRKQAYFLPYKKCIKKPINCIKKPSSESKELTARLITVRDKGFFPEMLTFLLFLPIFFCSYWRHCLGQTWLLSTMACVQTPAKLKAKLSAWVPPIWGLGSTTIASWPRTHTSHRPSLMPVWGTWSRLSRSTMLQGNFPYIITLTWTRVCS